MGHATGQPADALHATPALQLGPRIGLGLQGSGANSLRLGARLFGGLPGRCNLGHQLGLAVGGLGGDNLDAGLIEHRQQGPADLTVRIHSGQDGVADLRSRRKRGPQKITGR